MRLTFSLLLHLAVSLLCLTRTASADEYTLHSFERQQLSNDYFSEGASAGDMNGDGVADVVYGPYWFSGPDFKTKHEIYKPVPQDRHGYADNFFSWVDDINGDGWDDVFVVGFPARRRTSYENPPNRRIRFALEKASSVRLGLERVAPVGEPCWRRASGVGLYARRFLRFRHDQRE